ncbi:hypothetical protein KVT40_007533 [Elsinoe batatas]|uniref:Uncharacterized protein n=1 Tax=Elsinoe batatas TaxID=2601811 RepID=A0A8K0PCD8_9PEZI|nr:hypothetical protein KVT40_007533 [Elsinoe batatas]
MSLSLTRPALALYHSPNYSGDAEFGKLSPDQFRMKQNSHWSLKAVDTRAGAMNCIVQWVSHDLPGSWRLRAGKSAWRAQGHHVGRSICRASNKKDSACRAVISSLVKIVVAATDPQPRCTLAHRPCDVETSTIKLLLASDFL